MDACCRAESLPPVAYRAAGKFDENRTTKSTEILVSETNDKIEKLLNQTMIATLSTLNEDGSPNTMPLWYEWNGESILMFSAGNAGKIKRLRRDPRATLCIAEGVGAMEAWVSVEGSVEVIDDLQRTRDFACGLAERYYEPERAKPTVEAYSKAEGVVILELKPSRIRSIWGDHSK
jgi:PPOX class probable F420-dependent enzyme